jgi:hypothetical protein
MSSPPMHASTAAPDPAREDPPRQSPPHLDVVGGGVVEEVLAALELLDELLLPPRRQRRDGRVQRLRAQLEPHLLGSFLWA